MKNINILFFVILFYYSSEIIADDPWGNKVYLATYPRSGNHWTRYMIEESTNLVTSSVYREPNHNTIAPWGGYCLPTGYFNNCTVPKEYQPIVIKTHYPFFGLPSEFDLQPSIITIRVIRHPVDSFYSHHLRSINSKPGSKIPEKTLKHFISRWTLFQEYWDSQPNVFTIRYEDMLNDPDTYFRQILQAIGYEVDEIDIERALNVHPPKGEMLKHLKHFTQEDLTLIHDELNDLMHKYGYTIPGL
jgi:Sulfotransferase domain